MRVLAVMPPILLLAVAGCAGLEQYRENPTTIGHPNFDIVWNQTIAVVEKYFDVAYENRYSGEIETLPQAGSTFIEPFRFDTVGFRQRLEASLQSIRRRAYFRVQPGPAGGFVVSVEVYKELEDLANPIFAQYGGGTFIQSIQPVQEALVTSDVKPSAGWISLGRDLLLEARIIADLHEALDVQ